jgi:hypothetical protein
MVIFSRASDTQKSIDIVVVHGRESSPLTAGSRIISSH